MALAFLLEAQRAAQVRVQVHGAARGRLFLLSRWGSWCNARLRAGNSPNSVQFGQLRMLHKRFRINCFCLVKNFELWNVHGTAVLVVAIRVVPSLALELNHLRLLFISPQEIKTGILSFMIKQSQANNKIRKQMISQVQR